MSNSNDIPGYWKNSLSDIDETVKSVKKARVTVAAKSAGGRDIYLIEYGKQNTHKQNANFSSAVGSLDLTNYKKNDVPCILLVAGTHGAEFEGIVAVLNLISLFETGKDLQGNGDKQLSSWKDRARILIIPCINPDGRARVKVNSVVGMDIADLRRWGQGVWKDGRVCDWPDCKKYHPIKEYVSFLGGYFNDDGINIMHDNFFVSSAPETTALLKVCSDNAPDFILKMHGNAGIGASSLHAAPFGPAEHLLLHEELEENVKNSFSQKGRVFYPTAKTQTPSVKKSFSMASACYAVCGALSTIYESEQGVISAENDKSLLDGRYEIIYDNHKILFKELDNFMSKNFEKFRIKEAEKC